MKNPFQHGFDYVLGRCKCPGCNTVWGSYMIFDDMLCFSGTDTDAVRRWSCPNCGFKKDITIWKKTKGKWKYIYKAVSSNSEDSGLIIQKQKCNSSCCHKVVL